MSPDLHAAIDFVAECGSGIVAERDRRMKRLRVIASLLEPLSGVLDSTKLPCARLIADEFNVAWTVVALVSHSRPSHGLTTSSPSDTSQGSPSHSTSQIPE